MLTAQSIINQIKDVIGDTSINKKTKKEFLSAQIKFFVKKFLLKFLKAELNKEKNILKRELDLNKETVISKSNKQTGHILTLINEKSQIEENCKNHAMAMIQLKKNGDLMIEEESSKVGLYEKKYNSLVEEVDKELPFNEEEAKVVEEENQKLKERAKNIHEVVKQMDEEYKTKIEGLSKKYFLFNIERNAV